MNDELRQKLIKLLELNSQNPIAVECIILLLDGRGSLEPSVTTVPFDSFNPIYRNRAESNVKYNMERVKGFPNLLHGLSLWNKNDVVTSHVYTETGLFEVFTDADLEHLAGVLFIPFTNGYHEVRGLQQKLVKLLRLNSQNPIATECLALLLEGKGIINPSITTVPFKNFNYIFRGRANHNSRHQQERIKGFPDLIRELDVWNKGDISNYTVELAQGEFHVFTDSAIEHFAGVLFIPPKKVPKQFGIYNESLSSYWT